MKSERGQALILIALGMVALLALVALALDGGMAFAERRSSQNAADNAALAAAYKMLETEDEAQAIAAAENILELNGYTDANSIIIIPPFEKPSDICVDDGFEITVIVSTSTATSFGNIVGADSVDSTVRAVTRACFPRNERLFDGNAIVGLGKDKDGYSFNSGNSNAVEWTVRGGGVFANNDAFTKNSTTTLFPEGHCVTAVGSTNGFGCTALTNQTSLRISYPDGAAALLPPKPECSGEAYMYKIDGKGSKVVVHYREGSGHESKGSKVSFEKDGEMHFDPGIYCITGADKSGTPDIYGDDVLFWVVDPDKFEMGFSGGGGFFTTKRVSGPPEYNGYMFIIPMSEKPCTSFSNGKPILNLRGNGGGNLTGTVLAPSSCIDYRGNAMTTAIKSQIIAYIVSSNGNAEVNVQYDSNENRLEPMPPVIELLE